MDTIEFNQYIAEWCNVWNTCTADGNNNCNACKYSKECDVICKHLQSLKTELQK